MKLLGFYLVYQCTLSFYSKNDHFIAFCCSAEVTFMACSCSHQTSAWQFHGWFIFPPNASIYTPVIYASYYDWLNLELDLGSGSAKALNLEPNFGFSPRGSGLNLGSEPNFSIIMLNPQMPIASNLDDCLVLDVKGLGANQDGAYI